VTVVFSLWYPASRARSQSRTNLALCTDLSPSLGFSGSTGFGTWRILVPLSVSCFTNFWLFGPRANSSLLSLLFLDFRTFCLWILYTLFTLVLLRHQGGVFYNSGFSILCLPFVLLRQKDGVFLFLDRECIFKLVKWFLSQNGQMESLLVLLATFCWQNHYYVMLLF
jgi:hypothetical protein